MTQNAKLVASAFILGCATIAFGITISGPNEGAGIFPIIVGAVGLVGFLKAWK